MRGKWLLVSVLLLGLMLGAVVGLSTAQGVQSEGDAAPQALVGRAFTYQGRLNRGGSPYSGECGFRFSLHDALSDGNQVGNTQTIGGVDVEGGLFTVALNSGNEFGDGAFRGEARWLAIEVQCTGDGSYTPLDPRQELTPAPYALALPGLWTEQNATSPNVIGGYRGNSVADGVVGATIGGGGEDGWPNQVLGEYGTVAGGVGNTASHLDAAVGGGRDNFASGNRPTIGGGQGNYAEAEHPTISGGWGNQVTGNWSTISGGKFNTASGSEATIGGGHTNTASGPYATVGGGEYNTANGDTATVGGGAANTASGDWGATVAGGWQNTASREHATVGGGYDNTASGQYATVGGGGFNTTTANYATIGGGYRNTASGGYDTVGGGAYNTASGGYATVPGGRGASTSHYGQMAYASGQFASPGDAQTSVYVLRNTTTNADPTELFLNGSSLSLTIAPTATVVYDILVVARSLGDSSAGYIIRGIIENDDGTTSLIGAPMLTVLGEDRPAWNVAVGADNTNDALVITVTGEAGYTIRWVATVRTVEVGH